MVMIRCDNDEHIYDDNEYISCPYCRKTKLVQENIPLRKHSRRELDNGIILDNGNYEISNVVSVGELGITYNSRYLPLDMNVLIKEVFPVNLAYRGNDSTKVYAKKEVGDDFNTFIKKSKTRLKNMSRIKTSNTPDIKNIFEENNTIYIVMPYIYGVLSRKYFYEREDHLTEEAILKIFRPIMNVIHTMHNANILHLDIKPDNILVNEEENKPYLVDLDSAISKDELKSATYMIASDGYSPIEQYSSFKKIGPWTDIYSLGCTMYSLMFKDSHVPSATDRAMVLVNSRKDLLVPAIVKGEGKYSNSLLSLIDWMTNLDIRDRPQSIGHCIKHLDEGKVRNILPDRMKYSDTALASTHDNPTLLNPSERKKKTIQDKEVEKTFLYRNMIFTVGGIIIATSILSFFDTEPSTNLSVLVASIGAIIGLFLRGKSL